MQDRSLDVVVTCRALCTKHAYRTHPVGTASVTTSRTGVPSSLTLRAATSSFATTFVDRLFGQLCRYHSARSTRPPNGVHEPR